MKDKIKALTKKLFDRSFLKFILTGVLNTLVGGGIMFIFYNVFHINYYISSASNYIFGSILSYFLNRFFTFNDKKYDSSTIPKFVLNILICYAIAYGVAKPLTAAIFANASVTVKDNLAMLVGMGFFAALNYFGQRFFVFKKGKRKNK